MNNNKEQKLFQVFLRLAKEALSQNPEVKHSWSVNERKDRCILEIPEQNEKGFDIRVDVYGREIKVWAMGKDFVQLLDYSENPEETVVDILGLIRDLLSPTMRIRELRAGDSPYRWHMECLRNGEWVREESFALLFWNFFGKRSEKIYQNFILERRLY
jgi:hypothetical protein